MSMPLSTRSSQFGNHPLRCNLRRQLPVILLLGMSLGTNNGFQVRQASAGIISADELTDFMMEYQSEQLMMIGRLFGPAVGSPLSFSSTVDAAAMTYSFQLDPGSTYLGQSMTLSGLGVFDTAIDRFDRSAVGSLGDFEWTSAGTDVVGGLLDDVTTGKSNEDFKDENGEKFMDIHDDKEYNKTTKKSKITTQLTKKDGSNDGEPNTGKDRLRPDGSWELVQSVTQFDFEIVSNGFSPPGGGDGSFTSSVNQVPEPCTLAMLSAGMLAYGVFRSGSRLARQRRAASDPRPSIPPVDCGA